MIQKTPSLYKLFLILVFFNLSCKKELSPITNDQQIQNVKNWLKEQKVSSYSPDWESAQFIDDDKNKFIIVSSKYPLSPINKTQIQSYLIVNVSEKVYTGKLVEYVNSSPSLNKNTVNWLFEKESNTPNYKGDILVFDINHKFIEGYNFTGDATPNKIVARKNFPIKNKTSANKRNGQKIMADGNGHSQGDAVDCIDWYWVVYDTTTGDIISEAFLYRTCTNRNEDGGSEGSGSSGEAECNEVSTSLAGGTASELLTSQELSTYATTREKAYSWVFFKQKFNLWRFVSREKGTHVKNSAGEWTWKSLEHISESLEGIVLGGEVECLAVLPIVTKGIYYCGMELNYTIKGTAITGKCPFSISRGFTSRNLFNVND